jgi:hypothetical protein
MIEGGNQKMPNGGPNGVSIWPYARGRKLLGYRIPVNYTPPSNEIGFSNLPIVSKAP